MFQSNKGITTLVVILIIIVGAILVGGILIWQLGVFKKEVKIPRFTPGQREFSDDEILAAAYSGYQYPYTDKSEIGSLYLKRIGSDDHWICFNNENDALNFMRNSKDEVALNVWGYHYAEYEYEIKPPKRSTEKSFIDFEVIEKYKDVYGTIGESKGFISALNCSYFDTTGYNSLNNKKGNFKLSATLENIKMFSEFYWRAFMRDEKILSSIIKENDNFVLQEIFSIKIPPQEWSPQSPFEQIFLMNYSLAVDKKDNSVFIVPRIIRKINGRELLHAEPL